MPRPGFESVDQYLAAQSPAARRALTRVRNVLKKALPGATEGISYQIPILKLDGAMVLYFAGFQKHWSIYPATEAMRRALKGELAGVLHNKATLRFPLDQPVPVHLVSRIAKVRADEVAARAAAKRAAKKPGPRPGAKRRRAAR